MLSSATYHVITLRGLIKERVKFIKLIAENITAGFTELGSRELPNHDPVVRYFLKKGHFTFERWNIYKI